MKRLFLITAALVSLGACRQGMYDQAKYEPLEGSPMFADGRASRPLIEGTIPQGGLERDNTRLAGKANGKFVETYPMKVDIVLLERGRERYDIFCAACHGPTGAGDGMVVQRGFPAPPSLHDPRLRAAAPGYTVDVITNGFGVMYSYADRVSQEDRWAIAAYIRALQRSQNAAVADVPAADRPKLEAAE